MSRPRTTRELLEAILAGQQEIKDGLGSVISETGGLASALAAIEADLRALHERLDGDDE